MSTSSVRAPLYFGIMALLLMSVGFLQSWNSALSILNFGLISAIMALGVNLQWGYAGLFNAGVMGFVALGGLAVVVTSHPPIQQAWQAGGIRTLFALMFGLLVIISSIFLYKQLARNRFRGFILLLFCVTGFFIYRHLFDGSVDAIESVNPSVSGFLGGLGLPVLFAWVVGGLLAAAAAWVVGKAALGLRSDYLAIATLGIAEIIIAVIKNEEWLTRGVKNVIGLPRPVPYEVDLQETAWFQELATSIGANVVSFSTIFVKLCYSALFIMVILLIITLMQLALDSPWGRMVRAIRDNEVSASAMGKDVKSRHLQIFVLGAAICGIAGAMMTTLDGQLTPTVYQPLRYTFLVWVMVIVGGSGNNWGAVLGGMFIWFLWIQVEPISIFVSQNAIELFNLGEANAKIILDRVPYMRYLVMGLVLLIVLRFNPRGMLPER